MFARIRVEKILLHPFFLRQKQDKRKVLQLTGVKPQVEVLEDKVQRSLAHMSMSRSPTFI